MSNIIATLFNKIGYTIDEKSQSDVEKAVSDLKGTITKILGVVGVTLTLNGVKNFVQDCAQVASDAQEMERKATAVFGSMAGAADEWSETFANSIGRSKTTIKTYLTDMQNLFTGFTDGTEEDREACLSLSEMATQLAIDNASFDNTDEEVAIERMTKAIMGETEAARSMGAILNENTRAEAMAREGIQGKYDDLDQYTKMMVNYYALSYQMKDAEGDAAASTGYFEGQSRQLAASQQELKEVIGNGVLPLLTLWNTVQRDLTEQAVKLAKAVFGENAEDVRLQKTVNRLTKAYENLKTALSRMKDDLTRIIEKLGGTENAIKLTLVAVGALTVALNFKKGVESFAKLQKETGMTAKALTGLGIKALAIAAVLTTLFLLVEDFVNFMQGNDSLIGVMFEKAGIDADEMREKISSAFEDIKTVVGNVIEGLKGWFEVGFDIVKGFFEAFDIDIGDSFGEAIATVIDLVSKLFDFLGNHPDLSKGIGQEIGKMVTAFAALKSLPTLAYGLGRIVGTAKKVSKGINGLAIKFMTLPGPVQAAIIVIVALAAAALLIYKNWDKIKPVIDTVIAAVKDFFHTAGEVVDGVISFFDNLFTSISTTVGNIKKAIVDGFQAAIDWITSLPSQAVQWGADIINSIVSGIRGAAENVGEAVSGVAGKIKSFLGFSEPEEGPLSNFHTYMPDMIDLMASGIEENKSKVQNALAELTSGMSGSVGNIDVGTNVSGLQTAKSAVASVKNLIGSAKGELGLSLNSSESITSNVQSNTLDAIYSLLNSFYMMVRATVLTNSTVATAGGISRSTATVMQTVEISNTFNGDKAAQKSAASAMDKSAKDATSAMARALAYAR